MSMVTTKRADMAFCPGCTHGSVLENIGTALKRMGLAPEQVCMVSDIGCIGISDRYFACHTFHGLHGRSITYAEGIKRARPDLMVIVLIGDGGCGIGTAHLVHAARRGIGIKVMVCNNFNFGMTGGQHSPTTPECTITPTTPGGAVDHAFDICQTVVANGAAHVGRFSAMAADSIDQIEAALRSPGFALLDLWELCVAYFVPANRLTPPRMVEMSEKLNMPFGLICDKPVKRPATPAVASGSRPAPKANTPERTLPWPRRTEISVAGSAGQRIRSAVGVIGEILVSDGLEAVQQDDFPITVRRGHSISNLIAAPEPIHYIALETPDLLVILSDDGVQRLGNLDHLDERCLLIADAEVTLPTVAARVKRVDLREISKQVGKPSGALAITAAGLADGGWIEPASFLAAARAGLRGKYVEDNIEAIRFGCQLDLAGGPAREPSITSPQETP